MANVISVETKMYLADGSKKIVTQNLLVENEINVTVTEDGKEVASYVIVCTNTNIKELVLGRLYTDGVINSRDDIVDFSVEDKDITVVINPKDCIGRSDSRSDFKEYPKAYIWKLIQEFSKGSELHLLTKSAHSCYLLHDGEIVFGCEDISRHNAVDKVAGHILLNNINPDNCIIYTSGRVPLDMITKVNMIGVPVLVAKAIPTDRSIQYAIDNKIVLIARARKDSYEVFAGN